MTTSQGFIFGVAAAALACTISGEAICAVPPEQLNRVVDLGLNHSEIGDTIEHLTDQIGGRLTNSPAQRAAVAFAMGRLKGWGLSNVHEEGYKFGRGWSVASYSVTMTAPRTLPLVAVPIAWTPGTNGVVNGEVVFAPISGPQDFASWQGKLAGKIVLLDPPGHVVDETEVPFHRWKPEQLANPILAIPDGYGASRRGSSRQYRFRHEARRLSQGPGGCRLGALLERRPKARSRRGLFLSRGSNAHFAWFRNGG